MWTTEHSIEMTATPEAVWKLWADVDGWPEWNADIDHIEISGPFEVGSIISMTPRGQQPVELRIAEARAPMIFVDEARIADTIVRTTHGVEPVTDRTVRVTYRMEISDPGGDEVGARIGPQISADFPETLAALASLASSAAAS
jgi:hypothetical protein